MFIFPTLGDLGLRVDIFLRVKRLLAANLLLLFVRVKICRGDTYLFLYYRNPLKRPNRQYAVLEIGNARV